MISQATIKAVVVAIRTWRKRWPFYEPAIPELLRAIADVPSNKSFSDTMKAVVEEYEATK